MVTLEQIDKIQDAFEGKMFDEILNEHPYTDYFRAMIALAPCACMKSALLAAWGCLGFPMVEKSFTLASLKEALESDIGEQEPELVRMFLDASHAKDGVFVAGIAALCVIRKAAVAQETINA